MVSDIIFLLLGLVLIVAGGNYLTDGAVAVAYRFRVSQLVVGLTVVAVGSSAPDLVVALTSTIEGHSVLAIGDVVGANIFDLLLAVGIMAMISPVRIDAGMRSRELPMLLIATVVLFACGADRLIDGRGAVSAITRTDGLMMLCFFAIYLRSTFDMAHDADSGTGATEKPSMKMWLAAVCIVGGLAALVVGGDWIVKGASGIALKAGLPESTVALTIVAIGGSVPDLATSLVAALKGNQGIAMGNLVGSCIFNIFFILGVSSMVGPIQVGAINVVDFSTMILGALLLFIFGTLSRNHTLPRWLGAILCLLYIAYMFYVVTVPA